MTGDDANDNPILIDALRAALDDLDGKPSLVVALSGGGDSSALLHALAGLRAEREFNLRAVHVDHDLHADSASWAKHCETLGRALDVAVQTIRVNVDADSGQGLEAAARDARYAALFAHSGPQDVIALAQHRDDQVETVLLRLLRGSGGHGLSAMRMLSKRGGRQLWRPWLAQPRSRIDDYRQRHRIHAITDPANSDQRHARSRLRHEVLPLLRQHWSSTDAALAQSAMLLAEESERIARLDRENLAQVQGLDPDTLSIQELRRFAAVERRGLLRVFLDDRDAAPVPARVLDRLDDLIDASSDAEAMLRWDDVNLRRHRDLLHLCRDGDDATDDRRDWDGQSTLALTSGWQLRFQPPTDAALALQVTRRQGGERLQLQGKTHSQDLNKLLQETGVPPWQRDRLPLLWMVDGDDPTLLAVADLFRSEALRSLETRLGCRLRCFPPAAR